MSYFAIGKTAFQPRAKLFHATECTSALELRHCDGRNCEQSKAYHTNPDDNTDHVCKLMGRYVGEHEVCPIWAVMLVKRIDALLDLEKAAVAAESAASTARVLMVDAERGGEQADA